MIPEAVMSITLLGRKEAATSALVAAVVTTTTTGRMTRVMIVTTEVMEEIVVAVEETIIIIMTTADRTTLVTEATAEVVTEEGTTKRAGVMATGEAVTVAIGTIIPEGEEVMWCHTQPTMDKSHLLGIAKIGLRSYAAPFKKPCLFCFSKIEIFSLFAVFLVSLKF